MGRAMGCDVRTRLMWIRSTVEVCFGKNEAEETESLLIKREQLGSAGETVLYGRFGLQCECSNVVVVLVVFGTWKHSSQSRDGGWADGVDGWRLHCSCTEYSM